MHRQGRQTREQRQTEGGTREGTAKRTVKLGRSSGTCDGRCQVINRDTTSGCCNSRYNGASERNRATPTAHPVLPYANANPSKATECVTATRTLKNKVTESYTARSTELPQENLSICLYISLFIVSFMTTRSHPAQDARRG